MKTTGVIVLVLALIGLIASLAMDVTVGTMNGSRVVNFGLVAERNSIQMISGFAALCGVILIALGGRRAAESRSDEERVPCPACAELILPTAKICKHCHSEIESHLQAMSFSREEPVVDAVINEPISPAAGKFELYYVLVVLVLTAIIAAIVKFNLS
ncbi:hypothetical protein [Burkholderia pseudomallei]|uniref:hypothetical protein n=1 Tax=Burkholderia pseudomallei TaxID=28450 RepID=UPI00128FE5D2|nr:hypothetical protein [Burkholderia pseudomallei]MCQ8219705.1 phage terminase large subunit family protein [Burkholderia pseudomallei]MCW0032054.1 phage terminase large subunit family protein [Burkholderia pseudomallei]MCW0088624.1 phage terminase large subunit family protein [Burkholderia pseudomallei]MCW0109238.1 phage terminase large subunit family protein [Burkholderia pseudomallei]MCW0132728.1 phage terminase large subunit family protein [Burkholderia pseudomallei]